jgi:threonine synthase
MITLATAHPAKFPAAVAKAVGAPPSEPAVVALQRTRPERMTVLPNDFAAIADFIGTRTRAQPRIA